MKLRDEYSDGTLSSLSDTLRQHVVYCLYENFDQVLNTDLIEVFCCSCGKSMLLHYDKITTMYCNNCNDTEYDTETITAHMKKLQDRLLLIKSRLLNI